MNLFKKLFSKPPKTKTKSLGDQALELSNKIIIKSYRRLGRENFCAPTDKTSDEKILEIYSKVATAFRQVAEFRGEIIPAVTLNAIIFQFYQKYEMMSAMGEAGVQFFEDGINYEAEKYKHEGLREEHKNAKMELF